MTALTASEDHAIVMTMTYESETKGLTTNDERNWQIRGLRTPRCELVPISPTLIPCGMTVVFCADHRSRSEVANLSAQGFSK